MTTGSSRGIFVLGMHRSGTSCLTGMLESSGVWMGEVARNKRPFNPKGNLENISARKLNNEILKECGGDWARPPETITVSDDQRARIDELLAEYQGRPLWALKDPRVVLLLDAWRERAGDVTLVGTYRHPLSVAQSLLARNEMPLEEGLFTWHRYNRDLVEQHRRHGFPLVTFDVLGDDYVRQYQRLCEVIDLPFDEARARAFYEQDFVRQAVETREVPEAQRETYEYLVEHTLR